jgi:ubiquitin-conjugating enzyme E2 variant
MSQLERDETEHSNHVTNGTRRQDGSELAAGYSWKHRVYEWTGIILATVLGAWLIVSLFSAPTLSGWFFPLAAFCGVLFADFISGFVHWLFDSWGSVDTPVVGALAIRTFREHHVDQKSITRHDFVETNGHNISLSVPVSVIGIYALWSAPTLENTFVGMWMAATGFFVAMTSQIHKWAHMDSPPAMIAWMQRVRLILSAPHHAKHHAAPFDRNYCITVGWMNGPLRAVRFFETLERVITAVTGAIPREDDIGKEAALDVLAEETPEPVNEDLTARLEP